MNFTFEGITHADLEAIFGPLSADEEIVLLPKEQQTWTHLAVKAGIFPSLNQAKKNNWVGDLPLGYNEVRKGKRVFYLWFPKEVNEDFLYQ